MLMKHTHTYTHSWYRNTPAV